jgi:hypothetical protein
MTATTRRVEYFYATVSDRPGQTYDLLTELATCGVNLLAFSAVPIGPDQAQFQLFPEDVVELACVAERTGIILKGPHEAFLIQGDDEIGSLVEIHRKLSEQRVNVFASTAVTDGKGRFGYLLYVRPDEMNDAAAALGI